jgi:hypothetical protein
MSPCHHVSTGLPAYSWTWRLVAEVCAGQRLEPHSPPLGSRIIGPPGRARRRAPRTSSPGADGRGLRGDRHRRRVQVRARAKALTSAGAARWVGSGVELIGSCWRSRSVEQRAHGAAERKLALTVTRSPSANGLRRQEARAVALRVGLQPPGCAPLREPAHADAAQLARGHPRKLICVCGEASRLPGQRRDRHGAVLQRGVVQCGGRTPGRRPMRADARPAAPRTSIKAEGQRP